MKPLLTLELLRVEAAKFAVMLDRNLPVDEIEARNIAEEILTRPPLQGYLTISNALQWRLQYSRVIQEAGQVDGIWRVR